MIRVNANDVEDFNNVVKNILYTDWGVENIDKYKNEILIVCKNLKDLGFLKVNLKKGDTDFRDSFQKNFY